MQTKQHKRNSGSSWQSQLILAYAPSKESSVELRYPYWKIDTQTEKNGIEAATRRQIGPHYFSAVIRRFALTKMAQMQQLPN